MCYVYSILCHLVWLQGSFHLYHLEISKENLSTFCYACKKYYPIFDVIKMVILEHY